MVVCMSGIHLPLHSHSVQDPNLAIDGAAHFQDESSLINEVIQDNPSPVMSTGQSDLDKSL